MARPRATHPDRTVNGRRVSPQMAGGMSASREALLSVRNLKTYFSQDEGLVRAVDGVSFDLYPGVTLGVVGESGCGKSVTARSILRIVDRPGRRVLAGTASGPARLSAERRPAPAGDDRHGAVLPADPVDRG